MSDNFIKKYEEIVSNLVKDDNGFIGRTASEKFDNMMLYLDMAITGDTEQEVRRRRKRYAEALHHQAFQTSLAENCP